jgi:hypothetical protein
MNAQFRVNANLVSLQTAALCANCEVISEGLNGRCDACGSPALLRLSGILGETIGSGRSFATSPLVAEDSIRVRQLAVTTA